jgi:Domain of unknown function (DUF222)
LVVVPEVALIRQANDALAVLDADGVPDDELEASIVALHREGVRLAAQIGRLTGKYDQRRVFRSDGSKTAAARLSRKTGASRRAMRAQVQLGRRLQLMPRVEAALAAGEITVEHAQILGKLAGSDRKLVADAFPEAEEQLLGYAKDLDFPDFVKAIRYWEQVVDEDGFEEEAERKHASRRLHLSETLDGVWVGDMKFDAIGGSIVNRALRRIYDELFQEDWAEAKAIHGDDTRVEHLERTPAQRRADAMVVMAERAMAAPKDARMPSPLFTVHVGYETFAGRLCELASGTVLTPGQLVPWLTRAYIERAVFDGPNRVIELGQRTRFYTGGLRRAVQIRDRFCVEPGCDVPAEECDIDHDDEYEDGGLTTQRNARSRCGCHNRDKHKRKKSRDP